MTQGIKVFFAKPGNSAHVAALTEYFQHAQGNVYVSLSKSDSSYEKMKSGCAATVHDNYWWVDNPNAPRIHNKCFAFERLSYDQPWLKQHVVAVTTGNMNANTTNKHECMVRFQSQRLYDAFVKRWREIEQSKTTGLAVAGWTVRSEGYDQANPESKLKAYFFPTKEKDLFVDILENIDRNEVGLVQLLVPRFRESRIKVAEALRAVAEDASGKATKVKVRVITRPKGEGVNFDLRSALGDNVELKVCPPHGKTWFHSRYMTVDAKYDGKRSRLVWMGTPNLTSPALRSAYETVIKIWDKDDEAYSACSDNYEDMRANYALAW